MNAQQRRRQSRRCSHQVVLECSNEQYFRFDARVAESIHWARLHCLPEDWYHRERDYRSHKFWFRSGPVASAFALRWL